MMAEDSLLRRQENSVIFKVCSVVYLELMLKISLGKDTLQPSFKNWAIVFNTKIQMSKFSKAEETQSCLSTRGAFHGTGDTWPWNTFKAFLETISDSWGVRKPGKAQFCALSSLMSRFWYSYTQKKWKSYLRYFSEVIVSSKFRFISNLLPLFVLYSY